MRTGHRPATSSTSLKVKGPNATALQAHPGPTLPPPRLTWFGQAEAVHSSGQVVNPHILRAVSILMKLLWSQNQHSDLWRDRHSTRLMAFLFLSQSPVWPFELLSATGKLKTFQTLLRCAIHSSQRLFTECLPQDRLRSCDPALGNRG